MDSLAARKIAALIAFLMIAVGMFAHADQIIEHRCNNVVSTDYYLVIHEEMVLRSIIHYTADEQVNGVYTTEFTKDPVVYGRSTCSTTNRNECQGCISQAVDDVNTLCGDSVGAFVRRELCTVRYETYPILGD